MCDCHLKRILQTALKKSHACMEETRRPCPANSLLEQLVELLDEEIEFSNVYKGRQKAKNCRKSPDLCQTYFIMDAAAHYAAKEFVDGHRQ